METLEKIKTGLKYVGAVILIMLMLPSILILSFIMSILFREESMEEE